MERRSFAGAQDDKGALRMIGTVWLKRAEGSALDVRNVICKTDEEGLGGGAWKTRGRPWPRERVDGACARRDGAKRKVFQVPPPADRSVSLGLGRCPVRPGMTGGRV